MFLPIWVGYLAADPVAQAPGVLYPLHILGWWLYYGIGFGSVGARLQHHLKVNQLEVDFLPVHRYGSMSRLLAIKAFCLGTMAFAASAVIEVLFFISVPVSDLLYSSMAREVALHILISVLVLEAYLLQARLIKILVVAITISIACLAFRDWSSTPHGELLSRSYSSSAVLALLLVLAIALAVRGNRQFVAADGRAEVDNGSRPLDVNMA